jgi:hypothetical protein
MVRHLVHRHRRRPRQDLGERAVMLRVEMLDEHETHARVHRQPLQQPGERLEPAG